MRLAWGESVQMKEGLTELGTGRALVSGKHKMNVVYAGRWLNYQGRDRLFEFGGDR
jgi:hypothetical protein